MATAKTVLGEVPANQLGITSCHEHLLLSWSAAKDDHPDEYSSEALAEQVVSNSRRDIQEYNIKTMVDVTPECLGRDVELDQLVAQKLGINIIAATGFYRERVGIVDYWVYQDEDESEDFMVREITDGVSGGINGSKVKCGVIKIGWGGDPPGDPEPAELKATHAAGRASKRTGCPIVVHSNNLQVPHRNIGLEQVQMLMESGADPERVQISHVWTTLGNLSYVLDIVKTGAYVALPDWPFYFALEQEEMITSLIAGLIRAGYGDKVVFAMDVQGAWFPEMAPIAYASWVPPGSYGYVYKHFVPRLLANGITEKEIEKIAVDNPAKLFAW